MVFAVALTALAASPLEGNTTPFELVETSGGVTLLAREVKGSPFKEYQVQTTTPLEVKDLCETVFEWATRTPEASGLSNHKVLVDGEHRRVIYSQISQPVVANRDDVLLVEREWLAPTHCRLRFEATTEGAPPVPKGFVRMHKVYGEWRFVAQPTGGSSVSYTLYSDPAGSIPAFLVHGAQKAVTRDTITRALERTKQAVDKRAAEQRSLQQR